MSVLKLFNISLVIGIFSTVVGCATPHGVVRTPLDEWEVKHFPSLGFSVEIPKQPNRLSSRYSLHVWDSSAIEAGIGCKVVFLNIHPIWAGTIFMEPHYLLEIGFYKMTEARFQERTNRYKKSFCSDIETTVGPGPFGSKGWKKLWFRKDYRMEGGTVLISEAALLRITDDEDTDFQADTNAIHRILNSVKLDSIPDAGAGSANISRVSPNDH